MLQYYHINCSQRRQWECCLVLNKLMKECKQTCSVLPITSSLWLNINDKPSKKKLPTQVPTSYLGNTRRLPWWWRQQATLKCQSTSMRQYSIISQKAHTFMHTEVRIWNLTQYRSYICVTALCSYEFAVLLTKKISLLQLTTFKTKWKWRELKTSKKLANSLHLQGYIIKKEGSQQQMMSTSHH
jgi:hypothetical protein